MPPGDCSERPAWLVSTADAGGHVAREWPRRPS